MSALKLCVACRHYNAFRGTCNHPKTPKERNVVTGKPEPVYASSNRLFDGWIGWFTNTCGKQGRWWEAKEAAQ